MFVKEVTALTEDNLNLGLPPFESRFISKIKLNDPQVLSGNHGHYQYCLSVSGCMCGAFYYKTSSFIIFMLFLDIVM